MRCWVMSEWSSPFWIERFCQGTVLAAIHVKKWWSRVPYREVWLRMASPVSESECDRMRVRGLCPAVAFPSRRPTRQGLVAVEHGLPLLDDPCSPGSSTLNWPQE